jgi:hypothetical protein
MIRKTVYAVGLLFASSALLLALTDPPSWKKGLVISAAVSGHGAIPGANGRRYREQQDIWWSYRIAAECYIYSVVSRRTPVQAGLQPDSPVKFLEKKSWIYVRDRDGKLLDLKIVRKDKSKECQ